MNGTARATGYGYSLWEFQVFTVPARRARLGVAQHLHLPQHADAPDGHPDLGPNVRIFEPSMPAATIQSAVDRLQRAAGARRRSSAPSATPSCSSPAPTT